MFIFEDKMSGKFKADLLADDKVILELKAVSKLESAHQAQLINYLKATEIEVGLLLNFGERPEFKRFAFDNQRKLRQKSADNLVNPRPRNETSPF